MSENNDEMKVEDTIELSLDDLEEASGGYILVREGVSRPYVVIDDETGLPRKNANDLDDAKWVCERRGFSDQQICQEEYKQKFGHWFRYY